MIKVYLGCPYTHADKRVVNYRVTMADMFAAYLMDQRDQHGDPKYSIFSPLSHSHRIARYTQGNQFDHNYWLAQDLPWLVDSDLFTIMQLNGWNKSFGLHIETINAKEFNIPTETVSEHIILSCCSPIMAGRWRAK